MADGFALGGAEIIEPDERLIRPVSQTRDVWRRFRHNRAAVVAASFLLLITLVAIFAPLVARDSDTQLLYAPLQSPSWAHWMGTDDLGRDLWSRVVYGTQSSLEVGVGSQLMALGIGVLIGGAAGLARGFLDPLLMRLTDVMQSLPQLLLALLFLVALGDSTTVLILALGLSSWPVIARVTRGQVLQLREQEFVQAAYSVGSSPSRTLMRHIMPNALGPVIVQITFGVSQAIFAEAFLSFIGLGPPPPNPTWGSLISDGFSYIRVAPHLLIFPGIVLSLTLLAVNFVGDGLRDAFDPQHGS
jgi:ABC-type dipeptide/oligopeptide/nickel transport system permease subunit